MGRSTLGPATRRHRLLCVFRKPAKDVEGREFVFDLYPTKETARDFARECGYTVEAYIDLAAAVRDEPANWREDVTKLDVLESLLVLDKDQHIVQVLRAVAAAAYRKAKE